jgi:hypothetical protein
LLSLKSSVLAIRFFGYILAMEVSMKAAFCSLALALLVFASGVQAQEGPSTKRVQAQHRYYTDWTEKHMKQTEASLIMALADSSVGMQRSAVQTLRELEQVFPEYPFSELLTPLGNKLKDENTDRVARRLVALALDDLHSEAGDAILAETAETTKDPGLATLCTALLIKAIQYK